MIPAIPDIRVKETIKMFLLNDSNLESMVSKRLKIVLDRSSHMASWEVILLIASHTLDPVSLVLFRFRLN
jgi:hypothetical protein